MDPGSYATVIGFFSKPLGELSKNSGVAKNTIKKYIEYLEAAFLLKVVHRVDRDGRRFKRANYFKVYLTNPSIRCALFAPVGADDPAVGSLVETAIFAQWFHSAITTLHYARWKNGEVDLVHLGNDLRILWAVDAKWSDRHVERPADLRSLLSFCINNKLEQTLATTRTRREVRVLQGTEVRFRPASEYLYTVGRNLIHQRLDEEETTHGSTP